MIAIVETFWGPRNNPAVLREAVLAVPVGTQIPRNNQETLVITPDNKDQIAQEVVEWYCQAINSIKMCCDMNSLFKNGPKAPNDVLPYIETLEHFESPAQARLVAEKSYGVNLVLPAMDEVPLSGVDMPLVNEEL